MFIVEIVDETKNRSAVFFADSLEYTVGANFIKIYSERFGNVCTELSRFDKVKITPCRDLV